MRLKKLIIICLMTFTLSACNNQKEQIIATNKKLGELTIYEVHNKPDICPAQISIILFEAEDYKYLYYYDCYIGHAVLIDNEYYEIVQYIQDKNIEPLVIEASEIGEREYKIA